ncbi:MAG: hypothetical protein WBV26_21160 [Candidatus Sulfotelmatobacter sp.]
MKLAVTGLNYNVPAVCQGIAGIENQVQDDLLSLRRIDLDQAQIGLESQFKLDVLADKAGQQILHILRNLIEAQRTDLGSLRAGENEQLAHQPRGLQDRRANFDGITPPAVVCIQTGEQEIAVQHDAGQQVVKIMHYASCQAAYRFPSLSLEQTFLDGSDLLVALGDKQDLGRFFAGCGQTPCGPIRYCQPICGTSSFCSFDTDAVASGVQQCAQK